MEFLTHGLNPPQKQAVETLNGPLLILAGAGSGKTRVLTHRVANLILQRMAGSDEILAVTFTNKAAREMEHRISQLLVQMNYPVYEPLWISTFHSFCVRVLRQHVTLLDYKSFFGIYDSNDQLSVIKKVAASLNINDKMYPAKGFQSKINNAKMLALSPDDLERNFKYKYVMDPKSLEVYKAYEAELKKANSMDFGDLLLKVYDLFRMYPDILEGYQNKFKYIMIDEYQDTNHIQYLLVQLLAKKHRNLCVVGDEDQSIYSWRGADISNILDFEKDFPEAVVIKLEENYRSSRNIVNAATAVIKNNSERKDKTLFTNNPEGERITVREERNEYDEGRFVAKVIQDSVNRGISLQDIAIFYRTNAQSRVLEEQMRTFNIPYKLVGGVRFYERMEIKDVVAYFKVLLNRTDDLSLKRIINVPARGIGKTTIDKLEDFAAEKKLSLFEAIEQAIEQRHFNAGTVSKLRHFMQLLQDLFAQVHVLNLCDLYAVVLERTQYLQRLKEEDSPESAARIENLEELSNALEQFHRERGEEATLQSFLEELALVSDIDSLDQEVASVTMMTLHISKGLEYPLVFIVGMEENLFPSAKSAEGGEDGSSLEEERRLAYVGMTRAREKLYLTYARCRRVWGQEQYNAPSRFLAEIPDPFVSKESAVGNLRFVQKYASSAASSYSSYKESSSFDDQYQSFPDDHDHSAGSAYRKGMKVRHPIFGVGQVFQLEGDGESQKISILFSDQTIKKFVAKHARLEKV